MFHYSICWHCCGLFPFWNMLIMHINEYNKTYTDAAKIRLDLVKCCNIWLFQRFKLKKKMNYLYIKKTLSSLFGGVYLSHIIYLIYWFYSDLSRDFVPFFLLKSVEVLKKKKKLVIFCWNGPIRSNI